MYCKYCGSKIEDYSRFCIMCGAALTPVAEEPAAAPEDTVIEKECAAPFEAVYEAPAEAEATPVKGSDSPVDRSNDKKIGKGGVLRMLAPAVAALLALAFILLYNSAEKELYETALELSEKGLYEEALDAFEALGAYRDSRDRAELAETRLKLDEGKALMAEGKVEQALEIFSSLGSIAGDEAKKCSELIGCEKAKLMFEAGNYAEAAELFAGLGDYKNSAELAEYCRGFADYKAAGELMEAGDFAAALEKLEAIDNDDISGLSGRIELCRAELSYAEAEALLAQGRHYDAFCLFLSVSQLRDAVSRAGDCVVEMPSSGEIYRNPQVSGTECSFSVKSKSDTAAVIKLYLEDGTLVSSLFVHPGETVSTNVPAGKYYLNRGFGEAWFGQEDYFGGTGRYINFVYEGESVFSFESGSSYQLTEVSYGHEYGAEELTKDSF